jgi:hypothetical protein
MVKVQLLELPWLSTAMFVTVVVPNGKVAPLAGELVTVTLPSQLSLAVTLKVTLLEHSPAAARTTRLLAGQLNTGGWVSSTVTVNVHWLLVPLALTAVLVTTVVPTGKDEPLGGTLVTLVAIPQRFVARTLKVTLLEHWPGAAFTVRLEGQKMLGDSTLLTVTVKAHELVLPAASVTTNRLVVIPVGKVEPLGKPAVCARLPPGQLSPKLTK